MLAPGATLDPATAAGYRLLAEAELSSPGTRILRLGLPPGRSIEEARAEIASLLPDAPSDANHLYVLDEFLCSGDACSAHAFIGWDPVSRDLRPRIGMIDSGINTAHPALAGQKLTVLPTDLGGRTAADRQHGTAIAAMLVGRGDSRVPGLLPDAELVAVEVFHRTGAGAAADAFALVQAMDILLAAEVQVINMSLSGPANAVLQRMVAEAAARNVGVVAAAGNGGPGAAPAYPAAWPEVVAVTALDRRLAPYRQASRGSHITLAAPGVNLWTAASVSGGRLRSGTSYAAPFVTAALAAELMRMESPDVPAAVNRLIACAEDLGAPGHDEVFGHGRLSASSECSGAQPNYIPASGD